MEVGTLQMKFSPRDGMRQQDDVRPWRDRRRRREGMKWPTEPLTDPWEADEDDGDGQRHGKASHARLEQTSTWTEIILRDDARGAMLRGSS